MDSLHEQSQYARKLAAMTAEGRMSAFILSGLPPVFSPLCISLLPITWHVYSNPDWGWSFLALLLLSTRRLLWVRGMVQPEVVKMEWSNQVLLAMLALILGSMVMSIALAVQRWFVAAAISAAERAGDEERIQELTTVGQGESALADRVAGLFRPAPGSKEHAELAELFNLPDAAAERQ